MVYGLLGQVHMKNARRRYSHNYICSLQCVRMNILPLYIDCIL